MKKPKLTDASVKGGAPAGKKSVQSAASGGFPALAGIALLLLLGLGIYSNSFDCSFHLDDKNSIIENPNIQDLSRIDQLYAFNKSRFIPYLTMAMNYQYGQLDVWGYHAFNLLVHLINALLVCWLTLLVFSTPAVRDHPLARHKNAIALITALLFVSHPLATQSVTYIVQRLASMAALFYYASMALYLKARLTEKYGPLKVVLFISSIIMAGLALFSKENSYTLPLAILLMEVLLMQSVSLKQRWTDYRVLLVAGSMLVLALFVYMRFTTAVLKPILPSGGNPYTVTSTNYLFAQFPVILTYIRLLVLPYNQNLDHDVAPIESLFDVRSLMSLLVILALIVLAIRQVRRNPVFSFGILFFFAALTVESSIIPINDLMFEHRTYLPSFGFFLLMSSLVFSLFSESNKRLAMLVLFGIVGINSVLTYQRNKVWKDELSLWSDVVSKSPMKARAYINRGVAHWTAGNKQQALSDYTKAIELNPNYSYAAYYNLGVVQSDFGQWDKAIQSFDRAIQLYPGYYAAISGQAIAYGNSNNPAEALKGFQKAIELNPRDAVNFFNRGNVRMAAKQWQEALDDYSKAIELDPNYLDAYCNRAVVYGNLSQAENAIGDCSKAIAINPSYAKAYNNRAISYYNLGKWNDAIQDYSAAIRLAPTNPNAYYYRGIAYMNLQQWDSAITDLSKVLELNPSNQAAFNSRAQAMAMRDRLRN
jgi:tetratricopeptide (TPR) repeat protein